MAFIIAFIISYNLGRLKARREIRDKKKQESNEFLDRMVFESQINKLADKIAKKEKI